MAEEAIDIDIQQQADGGVIVNLDMHRAAKDAKASTRFDANLAETLDVSALSTICSDLIEGITADKQSRTEWVSNYNEGLKLLGLTLESPDGVSQKTSTVRHPLLLWTIIKFQSQAQGEMLPASGPTKVVNDGSMPAEKASILQRLMNHYLTTTASEYYPDTDRGLFYLGYGGTIYKKVYKCPIRKRPVSECVYLTDLIVSQDAVDLQNALRVTHEIEMLRQQVKRYQKMRVWRDVTLGAPAPEVSPTASAEAQVTGVSAQVTRWQDYPHKIWECYTTLDLQDWGIKETDQADGEELPYRVTIDSQSRQILEIRRNWRSDDPLRLPRKRFVKWGLVPGIGFLAMGYLHLLGNHTKALTALERIIIDSGMFANFPGGVRVKGMRQETNEIQPGPGEFPEIDTSGLPIQQAIMALPYKGPTETMLALLQGLEGQGEKIAGATQIETGDGRTNVPVGTIMAQIEQATQIMTAVHKRLHQCQQEELMLLRELLVEQPEVLRIPNDNSEWTPEELASASLVPASDPNVPAHVHRIMQAVVLEQLSTAHPQLYNSYEVQRRILQTARISDPESVLINPAQLAAASDGPPPDPTLTVALLTKQVEEARMALQKMESEREDMLKAAQLKVQAEKDTREADRKAAETAAAIDDKIATRAQEEQRIQMEDRHHIEDLANDAAERASREEMSQFAEHNAADLAAQERQASMDIERMDQELRREEGQADREAAAEQKETKSDE